MYKFGFDLGSTSIGWSVVELDKNGKVTKFVDMGVRIFPDGRDEKTSEPTCVARRNARSARTRHDRILIRRNKVLELLTANNMAFSKDDERKNPYELRAKSLYEKLSLSELGRVLFNLSLRRGFKSNRKEMKGEEGGKLAKATAELEASIGEGGTLGSFLWERFQGNNPAGIKTRFSEQFSGNNIKEDALYPTRRMYETEFERIWGAQKKHHPTTLTDDLKKDFYKWIFWQRPLKPQEVGRCLLEKEAPRIFKAHPLFQKFRALQTVNQLRIIDALGNRDLTPGERERLIDLLLKSFDVITKKGELSFDKLKKHLDLDRQVKLNLESENRKTINADTTGFFLSRKECFGDEWGKFDDKTKEKIVEDLLNDNIDNDELKKKFISDYDISEDQIENIFKIPLEEGTGNVSKEAIIKLLPHLEAGLQYAEARKREYPESLGSDDTTHDALDYYGKLMPEHCMQGKDGEHRITNVSVHIALNQLRIVMNELIAKYKNPSAIAIELARELKAGTKQLQEMGKEQNKNKKDNDRINEELAKLGINTPSRDDRQRYKLWEMLSPNPLERRSVYTGEMISDTLLFSPEAQVDHILPFSRTFDDGQSNKIVCLRRANNYKLGRTPFEAFGESKDGYDWDAIWERAQNLPKNSAWRFQKDAMEKYAGENDCIARQLNDTKYMSRIAVQYAKYICPNKNDVYGLPGQMTALFRDRWGLDFWKNKEQADIYRGHHMHHAIDAFVIACMTRGQLNRLSAAATEIEKDISGKSQKEKRKAMFEGYTEPFPGFDRQAFYEKCENMVISYKPKQKNPSHDSSTVGALHEDTAYNLLAFDKGISAWVERRIPVDEIKEIENICDSYAEKLIRNNTPNALEEFKAYCRKHGKKKIRIKKHVKNAFSYIPIFRTKEERDECFKAHEEWYIEDGKAPGAPKEFKEQQKAREAALLEILKEKASKAYKWFVGGKNFCADIYQINPKDKIYKKEAGDWQLEVISNYMASLNKGAPMWKKKYPEARRIMQLKMNDMVMAEFDKDDIKLPQGIKELVITKCMKEKADFTQIVFKVKKMSSRGPLFLRPAFITKEEGDQKSWCASASSLFKYKARKIHVSATGKVIDPGFDNKWSIKGDT